MAKTSSSPFGQTMLEELAFGMQKVSLEQPGQALIDTQLDIWYAYQQQQLDNSKNCATLQEELSDAK